MLTTTTAEQSKQTGSSQHQGLMVIADSGNAASLVVVNDPPEVVIGARFQHLGMTWEIVRYRPSAKAYVAEPVSH
jgi:exopolysaccharide biosynthesis protein